MAKHYATIFFLVSLLLSASLSCHAIRHDPATDSSSSTHQKRVEEDSSSSSFEEGCGGVGEEECLMRRTLVAHTDYIYTQGKTP
ncbi:hypothetical protein ZIOFF_072809 [Zingiber officinale]|uniref:Phytosulfokine n=1 Tax=Zingiber officinale TaxID=94328 RepID=A0A8J5BZD5_ZINOF|nr:hypothetical protein ZIOFF_072809 [Zingiber officinale]